MYTEGCMTKITQAQNQDGFIAWHYLHKDVFAWDNISKNKNSQEIILWYSPGPNFFAFKYLSIFKVQTQIIFTGKKFEE